MLCTKSGIGILFMCGLFVISLVAQDETKQDQEQSPQSSGTAATESVPKQTPTEKPQPEIEKRVLTEQEMAEVRKLLDINDDLDSRMMFLAGQISAFQRRVPGVKKEFWQECAKFLNRDQLGGELAEVYATHYTQQDIKELIEFFDSRVGKKYVKVARGLVSDANQRTNEFGRKIGEKMADKLDEEGYAR